MLFCVCADNSCLNSLIGYADPPAGGKAPSKGWCYFALLQVLRFLRMTLFRYWCLIHTYLSLSVMLRVPPKHLAYLRLPTKPGNNLYTTTTVGAKNIHASLKARSFGGILKMTLGAMFYMVATPQEHSHSMNSNKDYAF